MKLFLNKTKLNLACFMLFLDDEDDDDDEDASEPPEKKQKVSFRELKLENASLYALRYQPMEGYSGVQ